MDPAPKSGLNPRHRLDPEPPEARGYELTIKSPSAEAAGRALGHMLSPTSLAEDVAKAFDEIRRKRRRRRGPTEDWEFQYPLFADFVDPHPDRPWFRNLRAILTAEVYKLLPGKLCTFVWLKVLEMASPPYCTEQEWRPDGQIRAVNVSPNEIAKLYGTDRKDVSVCVRFLVSMNALKAEPRERPRLLRLRPVLPGPGGRNWRKPASDSRGQDPPNALNSVGPHPPKPRFSVGPAPSNPTPTLEEKKELEHTTTEADRPSPGDVVVEDVTEKPKSEPSMIAQRLETELKVGGDRNLKLLADGLIRKAQKGGAMPLKVIADCKRYLEPHPVREWGKRAVGFLRAHISGHPYRDFAKPTPEQLRRERLPDAVATDEAREDERLAAARAAERRHLAALRQLASVDAGAFARLLDQAIAADPSPYVRRLWKNAGAEWSSFPTLCAAMFNLLNANEIPQPAGALPENHERAGEPAQQGSRP